MSLKYVKPQVGLIIESQNFGKYEVIEKLDKEKFKIRFLETGFTVEASRSVVGTGNLKDWSFSLSRMEGKTFPTLKSGDCIILEYKGSSKVKIKFLNTGTEVWTSAGNIKSGRVGDNMAPTMAGVGFIGYGDYTRLNSTKEYTVWAHMLHRCYLEDEVYKYYFDKWVTEEWFNFQEFAGWSKYQKGVYNKRWNIDKDILIQGNDLYHPDRCCYVPPQINTAVQQCDPQGTIHHGKWHFSYHEASREVVQKRFSDIQEGKEWYKTNKERVIKDLADVFKDQIDKRVYDALYQWKAIENKASILLETAL